MWSIMYYLMFSFPFSVICTIFGTIMITSLVYFKALFSPSTNLPVLFYKQSSLMAHILKRCKRLSLPFSPPLWARSGHVQTMLTAILPPKGDVSFEREYLQMKDKGVVALDWAQSTLGKKFRKHSPILLVIPGLTGDATGMSFLCNRAIQKGFRPVVFNKRGHGNSHITTPKLQSFGDPTDLRQVVKYLRSKFPSAKVAAVGSCAGSALLVSYLGEYGSSAIISAAACLSPGYDSEKMYKRGLGKGYDFLMLMSLKRMLSKHAKALSSVIDIDSAMKCTRLEHIEKEVYAKIYGYDNLSQYWEKNNPMREIDEISIPVMCVNSMDDPISSEAGIPYDLFVDLPNFLLVRTDRGGHCGFYEGPNLEPWADKVAIDYLKAALDFMDRGEKST